MREEPFQRVEGVDEDEEQRSEYLRKTTAKMSCNGCRVLRKGCSDTCILRPCLQWIETSEAQGHATVFVAKFFGRSGLMGLISAVPENQRSALFQSLLYEACGRTVNPVFGAVGLLWSGNWQICQAAVDTILEGGSLRPPSPSSLSSCLPANLSHSAPCPSALAMSGEFPFPSAGRVEDPPQVRISLPSNVSAANSFDRHTMNLGVGLPETSAQESKERSSNSRRNNASNNGWCPEAVHGRAEEPTSTWQNDGQCNSQNQLPSNSIDIRRDTLGYELQRGVHSQGVYVSPRRVRARVERSPVAPLGSGEGLHDELSMPAHGAEQLELDLTLKVKGERGEKMVGTKRLSSPCDSLNSEGSVTSLDSTLREPSRHLKSWPLEMTLMPPPYCQLLPLMH